METEGRYKQSHMPYNWHYLRNHARLWHSYNETLIGNHTWSIEWHQYDDLEWRWRSPAVWSPFRSCMSEKMACIG